MSSLAAREGSRDSVAASTSLRREYFDHGSIASVRWVDSSLQNGQVDKDDFPKPVVITSIGFVVEETDEYLTLARDDMGHDGDYRGLVAIPKLAVLYGYGECDNPLCHGLSKDGTCPSGYGATCLAYHDRMVDE